MTLFIGKDQMKQMQMLARTNVRFMVQSDTILYLQLWKK